MAGRKKTAATKVKPDVTVSKKQKLEDDDSNGVVEDGPADDAPVDPPAISTDETAVSEKEEPVPDVTVSSDQSAGDVRTVGGKLLICGGTNWDLIGRKELPKSAAKNVSQSNGRNLWGPHVLDMGGVRVKEVVSSCCSCHSVAITTDGKVMTWGRNDKGQLGLGDMQTRSTPTHVKALDGLGVITAACGKGHTLFLTEKGVVYSCGDNKMGQLGHGNQTPTVLVPQKISYTGKPIVRIAAGGEFSMIVDSFGGLWTFGSPEYGQLGHNSEGKFFTAGNKFSFHCETAPRRVSLFIEKSREGHVSPVDEVSITEIAAGINHALAVDKKKRCFSWGFAGYGRLGHSETKNELIPRSIKSFDYTKRGAVKVFAGSTFSIALDESGLLYFWGQSKSSGEATMYPKNIQDLCGWNIRQVACANKSIVVLADNSVISWGPSPTYGELGYGENKAKSSTIPQEMKLLDGIYIRTVACGFGHTLMIARDETQAEMDLIAKLPSWP